MPKIPIDEAPAGPEMDAAVARALGQQPSSKWRPSTDIAAAWEVWFQVSKRSFSAQLSITRASKYQASLFHDVQAVRFDDPTIRATGETAMLAICRAFLKAHGTMEIETQ